MSLIAEKNKATKFIQANKLRDAKLIYKKICKKNPSDTEAWNTLGALCGSLKDFEDAVQYCQKAISINPNFADAYNNIGVFFEGLGRSIEAIENLNKALQLNPNDAEFYFNLGNSYESIDELDKAIDFYQKSIALNPSDPDSYINLARTFSKKRKNKDAIENYQKALKINPNNAKCLNNLAIEFSRIELYDIAYQCLEKAIQLEPDFSKSYKNLSLVYDRYGDLDQAIRMLDMALELNPEYLNALTSKIFFMNYKENSNNRIFAEHKRWGDLCIKDISPNTSWEVSKDTRKKIRIAYVSGDFRTHSVAYFFGPILENFDKDNFEVICYSDVEKPDDITDKMTRLSSEWCDIFSWSDKKVSEKIKHDEIDILVDLAGHTGDRGPTVFAYKPAPIQITFIGYPNTTGLPTMDYRITDHWADPEDQDQYYTEKLLRLKDCFLCYEPNIEDIPDVSALPREANGNTSYCSFNATHKITPEVVSAWVEILNNDKGSRLIIKSSTFFNEKARSRLLGQFSDRGVDNNRIELIEWVKDSKAHLDIYNRCDIALDTFPYNGTTTTCEALWMGVPVITLIGNRHAARVGYSLLSQIGLNKFTAKNVAQYVELAISLSKDTERLKQIRNTLRQKISESDLCQAEKYTRNLEKKYREIWREWCEKSK